MKKERSSKGDGRFRAVQVTIRMTEGERHMLDYVVKHKTGKLSTTIIGLIHDAYDEIVNRGFR